MIVAANRLIKVTPPWVPALVWPEAEPDDDLDYSLDISAALDEVGDAIASVDVSVAPSGSGEMSPHSASFSGNVITVWLAGGAPSRVYYVQVVVTTVADRRFSYFVAVSVSADTAVSSVPPPPSPGYGTPVEA